MPMFIYTACMGLVDCCRPHAYCKPHGPVKYIKLHRSSPTFYRTSTNLNWISKKKADGRPVTAPTGFLHSGSDPNYILRGNSIVQLTLLVISWCRQDWPKGYVRSWWGQKRSEKKNHFTNDVKPLISKRADGVGFKQTKTSQMFSQLDSLLTLGADGRV